ncbi:MAG: restriction endonuclease subunit R [Candidatus Melainabacteria bacterium RIFOXYA12_FULL_32_12]|nr:MAG: restriction endonuclease subunit R [Candidatus Melainabacteria bacterium RIFOXYA12_FULL_32_12]
MLKEAEWKTRKDRIDTKLKALNPEWKIIKYTEGIDTTVLTNHAVEEFPTATGPADYALFVKGQLLGIIEAKKVKVGAQNVLEQAKRYSKGAFNGTGNWRGYRVPFLYSTNGEEIYFLDIRTEKNISRKISNFHTPDALEEFTGREKFNCNQWLQDNPNNIDRLRPYQKEAIDAVEKGIADSKRNMLIAMATGTGKTFTTVSLIYRLLESKAAKRVLFLVDRKALAAQSVTAFSSFDTPKGGKLDKEYEVYSQKFNKEDFEENEKFDSKALPNAYLTTPQSSHTFVYVSTIQRMTMNLFGADPSITDEESMQEYNIDAEKFKTPIPIHAFDVIIADECHRGYTSKETNIWRNVIDYFDAVKIGLTATPALHTVSYFGEPIYRYSVSKAIEEGFLVDYDDPVIIKSGVRINGAFLKEGEEVEVVDTDTGEVKRDFLEDEREFKATEIEHKITVPDSNRKIIQEIKKYAEKHQEETGRFPKTLIFASNDIQHQSHADELVKICKEEFGQGDDFVKKITGNPNVDRPLQKIREFRNRPEPKIVVTVDMLSTGVDIPALEFIVFLRPVKSRILWEQMLGRGTRLCKDINKTSFTIFDCFDGTLIEYFKNATAFNLQKPDKEVLTIEQIIENIYLNEDREYNIKALIRRLRRIEKNMSGEAYELFSAYIPDGDIGRFAGELKDRIRNDFVNTMKILRDKDFQDLLVNYPRAKKVFFRGVGVQDEVTSEVLIKRGSEAVKPEDYIEAFCTFVKENPEQVEAIKILLERPKDWRTQVLKELREKLTQNKFQEKDLQKAHQLVYNKALADIISMVKHAAKEQEPIFTAEERVNIAMDKFKQGKTFDEEQEKWLEYIKEHLIQNLTIELDDFNDMPIFTARGGLGRARKVFEDSLENLLAEINTMIAA